MLNLHMLLLKPDGQGFTRKYYPSGVSAQANKRSQVVGAKTTQMKVTKDQCKFIYF
jgi:hypothetical protein